ncbi:MAG: hypothetical protein VR72_02960 [Clostridiaceae bacterium BRH_c20a]|nr:MAG: hypothetical protein VR72_02960 [Clostridiaceae bacterium BRH_c20a]
MKIEIAMHLEEMTSSKGWEYVKGVMENKKTQALRELTSKKFVDLTEVKAQQTRISVIDEILGDINHQINTGKELKKKLSEEQSN